MSGHSKWATIHRQKEVNDSKRGQVFTKLAVAITAAVKTSGGIGDPDKNFKLRLAIEKARSLNMPKDNIQRAIDRATGAGGEGDWEDVLYEGYGPNGIAVMIEASTDKRTRTAQEVKTTMEKSGGTLAGPGAVSYQFERKGLITLSKPADVEEAILQIIDLGASDVEEATGVIEVYTEPDKLEELKTELQKVGFNLVSFEVVMKPKTTVVINDAVTAEKIVSFMEKLEELPDVQKVYSNFDISEETAKQLSQ